MGLSRPSVESTLFRARRRLTEEYDELVSGQRCLRIQTIITDASTGLLGARDQRRLARHIAHCQPCRKEARLAGVEAADIARRPLRETVAAKVAAFLPFPWLKKGDAASVASGSASNTAVQFTATLTQVGEPLVAGWSKAAAAAATLVVAGLGAGAATTVGSSSVKGSANEGATIERAAGAVRKAPAAPERSASGTSSKRSTSKDAASGGSTPLGPVEDLTAELDPKAVVPAAKAPETGTAPGTGGSTSIPVDPQRPAGNGNGPDPKGDDGGRTLPVDPPTQVPSDVPGEVKNAAGSVNGDLGNATGQALDTAADAIDGGGR